MAILEKAALNLQLFAFGNYYTNTSNDDKSGTSGTPINFGSDRANDLSPEMKTFYSKYLIKMAKPNLVHDQFGQTHPIPKNGGKTIEFRKYDPFPKALTPLTEGVTPDGRKLSVSTITAEVAQYGDYVELSDVLMLTAIDNNLVMANELLADQAGATLDTITREVLAGGKNVIFSGTGVKARTSLAAGDTLKVIDIKRAVRELKVNNAKKINGTWVAIIHPDVEFDITNDPEWISASEYAGSTQLFEGEIGKIHGVRFVETTEAKIWASASSDSKSVYSTLVLGANAYGTTSVEGGGLEFIAKQLGSAGTADPLNQRATAGWKAIKTAEILVDAYMVRIESVSTYDSAAN